MKAKKIITLFLTASLLCTLLTACTNEMKSNQSAEEEEEQVAEFETWDGTVATSFSAGDGSQDAPYEITTPAELAYLAKEVNGGNEYQGKFFSLKNNLDLANLNWTPIGNGTYSFNGTIEGNGKTISNMKIAKVAYYETENDLGKYSAGVAGLFGSCGNTTIKDLRIVDAVISISNTADYDDLRVGTLIGKLAVDAGLSFEFNNIQISNANITTNNTNEQSSRKNYMAVGGMAGSVITNETGQGKLERISVESDIQYTNSYHRSLNIGGIAGSIGNFNLFECINFKNQTTITADQSAFDSNIGTFGALTSAKGTLKLNCGFSSLTVDVPECETKAYAIAGNIAMINAATTPTYIFDNLHGNITYNQKMNTHLYQIDDSKYVIETNCQGCDSLPANHGFDETVWDLNDKKNPTIKF